jgi:type II secretory pathway pseudopilin PulG
MRFSLRSVVERKARRAAAHANSRRSEAGDTLIEVLIALVVLSLASVALITGFSTTISSSAVHRQLTTSGVVLDALSQQAIAEIQSQQNLFQCPQPLNYQALVPLVVAAPYTAQYTATFASANAVQYWNTTSLTFTGTCAANQPQMITITLTQLSNNHVFTNSFVVDSPLNNSSGSVSTAGPAFQIVFTTQPTGGAAGAELTTQPVLQVEDSAGKVVTTDLSPVTLTVTGTAGATLSGCSGSELAGVITFQGCTIDTPGTYQLTASDGALQPSSSNTFTVGAAGYHLVFTTQPKAAASGALLQVQPVVKVENSGGVVDGTWTGTISLQSSGGVLTNCSGLSTSNGVFTVANCQFAGGYFYNPISNVTLATPYTMTAKGSGAVRANPATSQTFQVSSFGAPTQLVFTTQPTGVADPSPSAVFPVQPVVGVEDSFGNLVTSGFTNPVSLTISAGSLGCDSNPATPSGGAVAFSGCHGSVPGTGITMSASSSGVTSTTSKSFSITSLASQLIFSTQPVAGLSGAQFLTQPVVTVEDSGGNVVTASTTAITLTSSAGTLSFCTSLTPLSGVVHVATCNFVGTVGVEYNLTATSGSLTATSGFFSPTGAGTPTQLVFTTQPVAGASESVFTTQPVLKVEDSGDNVVTNSGASITLASSGGRLGSCSNLTAVTGVVNVSNCTFAGHVGTAYTLAAASGSLSAVPSLTFIPTGPGAASASASSLGSSPASVPANGTTSSTVSVTLLDAYSNPIAGKTITLSQGSGNSVITTVSATTNASGVATFSATDTHGEAVTYTATDALDAVTITQVASVTFSTTQLSPPTGVTLAAGTVAGSINVSFTAPGNAATGQTYTVNVCDGAGMSGTCVSNNNFTSGSDYTGLAAGTNYFVTVVANASTGFLVSSASTPVVGPQAATTQLNAPTGVALAYGTVAGSISVSFSAPGNAAPSQTYTVNVCDGAGMTGTCVSNNNFTSGSNYAGLAYVVGSPGTSYYVTAIASASAGYLVSSASTPVVGPQAATSQFGAPGTPTVASSTTTAGAVTATFTPSSGTAPTSYTARACLTSSMDSGCVSQTNYTSGAQLTGLTPGVNYFVTITAVGPADYLNSLSAVSTSAQATTQLSAPTGVTLAIGTVNGSIKVTFTAPGTVAPSQTYTVKACTDSGMSLGCVTNSNFANGTDDTRLASVTSYYVTVVADASTGYLVSLALTPAAGPQAAL